MNKKSYFRNTVAAMTGYTPGEQPKVADIIKLNTNENPYPPSPQVAAAAAKFCTDKLRRYPDPTADGLRNTVAALNNVARENVIIGNGSDDILTMTFRAFTAPELPLACLDPTYSLYLELAKMQEAPVIRIPLAADTFAMPDNLLALAAPANLLIITRPNAPTGNTFPLAKMEQICQNFDGVVMFDEAYADFADDSCMSLAVKYPNVIVMRTLSKSYSLAGIRTGYAVASADIISGMMKLKDSYNMDALAQVIAQAALEDREYFAETVKKVKETRKALTAELTALGFYIVPSATNFLFARPPKRNGEEYFKFLAAKHVFVRYFKQPTTAEYVRITVGTPAEMARLIELTKEFLAQ